MPQYDFTTLVDRSAHGSAKWEAMKEINPNVPAGIAPLSVADVDIRNAPEIIEGLKQCLDDTVLGYTQPTAAYVDAVVGWMRRRHEWNVHPEWIRQSPGVVPGFFAAVKAFTGPGDGVIVQTPAYYPFYMALEYNRRELARNPLKIVDGQYRIDYDHLEQLAREPRNKVLLFCSPHNPTGRVWTREELQRVARIAVDNDLVLISDEIHFDLVMPGHRHTVMATLGEDIARRTITCTAPSKSFNLAGMGASNIIIADEALRTRFAAEQDATGVFFLTTLGYAACELAYTRGEAWLAEFIQLIAHNHALVKRWFAEHFPQLHVFDLEGTYLQWIDFRPLGIDADEMERINTQQAHLFFDEGKVFGEDGAGFERINLATPTHVLEAALERLGKAYGATG